MQKTSANLLRCAMVFVTALVISNVITAKTVATGFTLFDNPVMVPSAVICYCITFLMTDIVGEIWGKSEARTIVIAGFGCQVLASVLIYIGQLLPAASADMQQSYEMLLGANAVFTIASMCGYLLSQSLDVVLFHKIRGRLLSGGRSRAWRWVWNNASTMTSQLVDTVVFIGIAFGLGMGWFFDPAMREQLVLMMGGQYICKFLLAALDTPFFYFFTRKQK